MDRKINSSNDSIRISRRDSIWVTVYDFVACPFVCVRDLIRSFLTQRQNRQEGGAPKITKKRESKPELAMKTSDPKRGSRIQVDERQALVPSEPDLIILPSLRNPEATFLFVGLGGSGISTTAARIFQFAMDNSTGTDGEDLCIRDISEKLFYKPTTTDLRVIDVPGFCKENYVEGDAELVTALNRHLKNCLPNQIPSVTFIVTRFDDNRFEGEASQFSKMLIALSHSRQYWTDSHLTNVCLVLTYDSATIYPSEIPNKISRFKTAFTKVFSNTSCIDCMVVDIVQFEKREEAKSQLIAGISRIARRRNETKNITSQFLEFLASRNKIFQNPSDCPIPLKSLLPQSRGLVNNLLEKILEGKVYDVEESSSRYSDDENEVQFVPHLVEYVQQKSTSFSSSAITILRPYAKVMMFDGVTELEVQSLRVGDKLLDKDMNSNVVTAVNMIRTISNEYNGHTVGLIHVQVKEEYSPYEDIASSVSHPIVLRYHKRNIREVELKQKSAKPHESHNFFIVELDKDNGTFIVDEHVLYARHVIQ